jgi:glucose-1-phosphate cytidylyltransferase
MKVVILAGGLGTRLSEETHSIPKPMVEIGGKPILWHIMNIYASQGFTDFVICGGYKQDIISNYFKSTMETDHWDYFSSVQLVDTGENTLTGGRIKEIEKYVNDDTFMLTYGDGVANINISELLKFHKSQKTVATVTAVQPSGRFGGLNIDGRFVKEFNEKPKGDGIWINGGFFVCEPEIFAYIGGDCTFEADPINHLVADRELSCYKHHGEWRCCDTMKDLNDLRKMWGDNNAFWKTW